MKQWLRRLWPWTATYHVVAMYPAMDHKVAVTLAADLAKWDKRLVYSVRKRRVIRVRARR